MTDYSADQVGSALRRCGHYRVVRAQRVALEGEPDGISGALLLALGLRETGLRNINGGARRVDGEWVPTKTDRGIFQIASEHHPHDLARMPGVAEGTWSPVIRPNSSAEDTCPRFEDSLQFTLRGMHEAQAYAGDHGVPEDLLARFAVAAHNAGIGGALKGWGEHNIDKYTAKGDYSGWVLRHRGFIIRWLNDHPTWKPSAP